MTSPAVQQSPYRDDPPVPASPSHHVSGLSFGAERLEARRQTLGASEIPAVAGLNPYRTSLDVFLEKRGLVPSFQGNEFTEWGLRLEDVIAAKYVESFVGIAARRSDTIVKPSEQWMSATPDRLIETAGPDGVYGLEVKNKSARQVVKWGESGTDQVPHDIAAQCHWSMLVTGIRRWDVAVLFGGNEFRVYHLRFNEQIADTLYEIGKGFWFDHVIAGVEPPIDGSERAAAYIKAKFPTHGEEMLEPTPEIEKAVRTLKRVRESIDSLEQEKTFLENTIKNTIGVAAGIQGHSFKVTWKAPKPTMATDYKALVEELNPDSATLARFTTEKQNARRFLVSFPKD